MSWETGVSYKMDRVQLGAIYLPSHDSDHAESSSAAATTWSPVTSDKIRSGFLSSLSPAEETIVLLRDLLGDPGINFEAEYQRCDGKLAVRCSLIPSDGRGGNWRKRSRVDRAKLLKRLFLELKSGWEGGGDWLLASLVSDLNTGISPSALMLRAGRGPVSSKRPLRACALAFLSFER